MSVTTGASRCGIPSYTESSSIFGSIMIMRTSLGLALYKRLSTIALTATDLPEPVVPATSRCGILARSTTTGLPPMSLPSASASADFIWSYLSERRISDRYTICLRVLGISSPITFLPGITSTTRTLTTDRPRAMSLSRLDTCEPRTPGAGSISNRVITGPG